MYFNLNRYHVIVYKWKMTGLQDVMDIYNNDLNSKNVENEERYMIDDDVLIRNYDFSDKYNWKECLILLKSVEGKKVQTFGIKEYLDNEIRSELLKKNINPSIRAVREYRKKNKQFQYNKSSIPFYYNAGDGFCNKIMLFEEELESVLVDNGVIDDYDEYDDDLRTTLRFNKINKWLDPIRNEYILNQLDTYIITGSCFTYGLIINLYLAMNVLPKEDWGVLRNEYHAVVVNNFNQNKPPTMVFDILMYYSLKKNLEEDENYINRKDVNGTRAYLFATNRLQYEKLYLQECKNL